MWHRNAIAGAVVAVVCYTLGPGTAVSAEDDCTQATAIADSATLEQASDSVLCLVNLSRAAHDLAPLRSSPFLDRSAGAHSRDMVARQYFSHVSPTGATARERARRAGYLRKRRRGKVGETITWGTLGEATPAELVRHFMQSGGHRRVLLDRRYRDIGVGLVLGAPMPGLGDGATLTLDFGRR